MIRVPISELYNISDYRIGDYKQFYLDKRTRREYKKWAQFMITAEQYHKGNIEEEWINNGIDDHNPI